ncbi:MAG TPA: phosphoribosylglycinamide formyltransferase [Actinobacteria bacterium]|nr:phosphoribosylglycinamide formyltransferase [Actinomycetota bacterium]
MKNRRKRIAVFASGNGSNLQALIEYSMIKDINGDILIVFSNNPEAQALRRAEKHSIKTYYFSHRDFSSRSDFDRKILELMLENKIDLICLAGYMLLLSPEFINNYENRIINIHPSLLPSFKGMHGIRDAFEYGVKVTGATVHFVDSELDNGPVIIQRAVEIEENETIKTLEEKIHKTEHLIYPLAVEYFCKDLLEINGRKVSISERKKIHD